MYFHAAEGDFKVNFGRCACGGRQETALLLLKKKPNIRFWRQKNVKEPENQKSF